MLLADRLQGVDEVLRHRYEAALALNRLEHHAGDLLGVDVLLEDQLESLDALLGVDAAVRIRTGRAEHVGRERAEVLLVGDHLAGHCERQDRAPVEAVVEADDARAAGVGARDLDGVLDGFGARVDEQRLLVGPCARGVLGQAPAGLDVRLVHPDHEALVQEAVPPAKSM